MSSAGTLGHGATTTRQLRRVTCELQRLMRTKSEVNNQRASYSVNQSFDPWFASLRPASHPPITRCTLMLPAAMKSKAARPAHQARLQLSQRSASCHGSGRLTMCTCATPGRCRFWAPANVAVEGGNTMLSQWL